MRALGLSDRRGLLLSILLRKLEPPTSDHVGIIEETGTALVFRSAQVQFKIPFDKIIFIGRRGMSSAWWIQFGLSDSSVCWVSVREGRTAWGGCTATMELGERVESKYMGERLWLGAWKETVARHADFMNGYTLKTLPGRLKEVVQTAKQRDLAQRRKNLPKLLVMVVACIIFLRHARGPEPRPGDYPLGVGFGFIAVLIYFMRSMVPRPEDAEIDLRPFSVSMCISLLLMDRGWQLSRPGVPFKNAGREFDPFDLLSKLEKGGITEEVWIKAWSDLGLLDENLGQFAATRISD